MGRFEILLGKAPSLPSPLKKKRVIEKGQLVNFSKAKIPKKVNRLTDICEISDRDTTVTLQVSPRFSTCKGCRKKISSNTPRFKVIQQSGFYTNSNFYHRKCLPLKVKRFIKNYSKRNFKKEEIDLVLRHVRTAFTELNKQYLGECIEKVDAYLKGLKKWADTKSQ